MTTNNTAEILEPDFIKSVKENKELIINKPSLNQIPPGYPMIKDKTLFNSNDEFTKYFFFKGKLWKLYKRDKQNYSPWWFKGKINKVSYHRSCHTPNKKIAVNYAVTNWLSVNDEEQRKKNKTKSDRKSTIQDLFDAMRKLKADKDGKLHKQDRGKERAIERICETNFPGRSFATLTIEAVLNDDTIKAYQENIVDTAKKAARKEFGDDTQEIEKAEANAWARSWNLIRVAKNFFGDKFGPLQSTFEKQSIVFPEVFTQFKEKKAQGSRSAWDNYVRPKDELIKTTFKEIEKFAVDEPLRNINGIRNKRWLRLPGSTFYEGKMYHVYQMFWAAVGGGLRSKEIWTMKKSAIQIIDGELCFTGIGKTKRKLIDIQLQPAAAKRIPKWLDQDDSKFLLGETLNYRSETVPKILRAWMRDLGWETYSLLHMLRAYIGWRIYSEVSPLAAQQYLRHEKLEITEKFYAAKFSMRRSATVNLEF